MDINAMYSTAKAMVERVKAVRPDAVASDSSLCLAITSDSEIFTGISGIKITDDQVTTISAEYNTIVSLIMSTQSSVENMITISFSDYKICRPSTEDIELLLRANEMNENCEVALSLDLAVKATEVADAVVEEENAVSTEAVASADVFDGDDFNSGFDFDDVTPDQPVPVIGGSAEFVDSVAADKNNPFYEAPSDGQNSGAPEAINGMPDFISGGQPQGNPAQNVPVYGQPTPQPMGAYPQSGYVQQQPVINGQAYPQNPYGGQTIINPYGQPVNAYGQPVNPYGQPMNPQMTQSMQMGQFQQPAYVRPNQSVQYQPQQSGQIRQSKLLSGNTQAPSGGAAFRKRLNNYLDEGGSSSSPNPQDIASTIGKNIPKHDAPSIDEMMKQARDKKKVAKVNADFKKKMKDMGI